MSAPRRELVTSLIRREIAGRYRGSMLGVLWSLLTPLFMLTVYTLVFGSIFKSRWSGPDGDSVHGTGAFAVVLFAGLIVFQLFAEVLGRAPTLVTSNVTYVKKIVFPLEILPVVAVGSALFHAVVSFAVLLVFEFIFMGAIPLTALLAPLLIAPFLLLLLGLGWLFAAIGVYFRDIGQLLGPVITAMMFLSPVLFPADSLPQWLQGWHLLNPLTLPVEQMRAAVIFGRLPDPLLLLGYTAVAALVAVGGYAFFAATRRGFADVL